MLLKLTADQINGLIALIVVILLSVVLIWSHLHEMKYIKRAALALRIDEKYIPFLRCELLSIYNYQPELKKELDTWKLDKLVKLHNISLYNKIIDKAHLLAETEEEYGEPFLREFYGY